MTIEETLEQITRVAGVRAALLCSYDGIHIASRTAVGTADTGQIAAMSAEIGRAASGLLCAAGDYQFQTATFETSIGRLVMGDAHKGFVVALADQTANLGLLRMAVQDASRELSSTLDKPASDTGEPAGTVDQT